MLFGLLGTCVDFLFLTSVLYKRFSMCIGLQSRVGKKLECMEMPENIAGKTFSRIIL